nr:ComF family protein [Lysobacter sp. CJ11]
MADAVWPRRCHLCEAPGAMGLDLCATCAGDLPWMPDACPRCALPHAPGQAVCACELLPSWLDGVFAAFLYMAPLDAWLPRLKFHGDLALGDLMASLMAEGLASAPRPSCLIPVPLHTPRLRARGYNQAVELARPLAVQMGLPLQSRLLRRRKQTLAQSELGLEARTANMADAFEVRAGASLPRHVALVDDVMTTGATLQEAAWTLKDAGVARVDAWVCARVP